MKIYLLTICSYLINKFSYRVILYIYYMFILSHFLYLDYIFVFELHFSVLIFNIWVG